MYEKEKLDEAKFFYQLMLDNKKDFLALKYFFSAFLSASRSVLQYALEESKKKGRRGWYDQFIASKPALKYFKELRDKNIHIEPAKPEGEVRIKALMEAKASLLIEVTIRSANGKVETNIGSNQTASTGKSMASKSSIDDFEYIFWLNTSRIKKEDLFSFCNEYILLLNELLNDGRASGILTR